MHTRACMRRKANNNYRQLKWVFWFLVSENKCCFCRQILFHRCKPDAPNLTRHQLVGSIETDDMTMPAPDGESLWAHSDCHKRFHSLERAAKAGRKVDVDFARFKKNVQVTLKERK